MTVRKRRRGVLICVVDPDTAPYRGDGRDRAHYAAARGSDGWYWSVYVACGTNLWEDDLITDVGPYGSEAEALEAARTAADEWCWDNDVDPDPGPVGDELRDLIIAALDHDPDEIHLEILR